MSINEILEYIGTLIKFDHAYDLGCGHYLKSSYLYPTNEIVGVDVKQEVLGGVRHAYTSTHLNYTFICDDMLHYVDEYFRPYSHHSSVVVLCDSLEHLTQNDADALLAMLAKHPALYTIIFCPENQVGYNTADGRYDIHQSFWTESMLQNHGFNSFLLPHYHGTNKRAILAVKGFSTEIITKLEKLVNANFNI